MSAKGLCLAAACIAFLISTADASTTYTVKKGDNFQTIARKFHVSAAQLQEANSVSAKKLMPGQKISIPGSAGKQKKNKAARSGKKERTVARASRPAASQETAEASSPATASECHIVKRGDSLRSIARKYGITLDELKELNDVRSSKLKIGARLMVKRTGPRTHTVRKGDTIRQIAKRYHVDADDLMEFNEMDTPALKLGQKLMIDPPAEDEMSLAEQALVVKNLEEEFKRLNASEEFRSQSMQDKVIAFARKMVNIPYRFGGSTIFGIDCSAYVKKVYGLLGMELPRTAREQYQEGDEIAREDLSIGDLVFFKTYASFPSHVGIYIGNDLFIHASSRGKKVKIDSLDKPYYMKRYIGGKRILTQDTPSESAASDPKS